ncbi:MAG TPA: fumarylacetoacetate hydrolase family protein [Baekduia sp.]|uniref:2-keto-4-pentenoate hydratase n=1 Tax=Baekduia sp. TaxID=2600305 RepID=UPI002D176C6C|nr:fumarylacetoacetate hydrolase family protein [Baekduia sp.]HMJ37715.1 fumarylacetoacetate hydrolase family protein [Baekduia sp.]
MSAPRDPHAAIAERLWRAQRDGGLTSPPSAELPDLDEQGAYAIQRAMVERLEGDGAVPAGWKVGLTSAVGGRRGAPGPIYGQLLSDMVVPESAPIPAGELHRPAVEGEIAFVLDRPLRGPGVTVADVLAATRGVAPAIEIIAGRLEPGDHAVVDFIADNAASARVVLGEALVPVDDLDLRLVGMVQSSGGDVVATGAGARVLGHPAASVAWLANALADGAPPARQLDAGTFVLSGSLAPAVPAEPGDTFAVEFDHLGTVSAVFGLTAVSGIGY